MLTYTLNEKNKYYCLYTFIRNDILSGKLKTGEKLPSKRALALDLGVSVVTVQNAYEQLLAEGFIDSRERSGYFVAASFVEYYGNRPPEEDILAEDKGGNVLPPVSENSGLFPFSVWAKFMREVLSDCGEHLLERVAPDGDSQLKQAIAAYLYRARGINVSPRYIVIGAGAEYLYGVVVQLLGRDKVYAVENPGYKAISAAYMLNGASCVYATVNKNGVDCQCVEALQADLLHISPSHQFPTGAITPVSSRLRLIAWAEGKQDRYLLEDDYDSEFRLCGKPMQSLFCLRPDKVIYMNTFSKSLAPSMRMGYMVLPPELYERYLKLYGHTASVVPLFEQKTLCKMMESGAFERHINRMRTHYRGVREKLLKKLEGIVEPHEVQDTASGLHMTVLFPEAKSDEEVRAICARNGLKAALLTDYLLAPAEGFSKTAVLSYSDISDE